MPTPRCMPKVANKKYLFLMNRKHNNTWYVISYHTYVCPFFLIWELNSITEDHGILILIGNTHLCSFAGQFFLFKPIFYFRFSFSTIYYFAEDFKLCSSALLNNTTFSFLNPSQFFTTT